MEICFSLAQIFFNVLCIFFLHACIHLQKLLFYTMFIFLYDFVFCKCNKKLKVYWLWELLLHFVYNFVYFIQIVKQYWVNTFSFGYILSKTNTDIKYCLNIGMFTFSNISDKYSSLSNFFNSKTIMLVFYYRYFKCKTNISVRMAIHCKFVLYKGNI